MTVQRQSLLSADGSMAPAHVTDAVRAAVAASTSANTKKAYRSDWSRFDTWCTQQDLESLPASPFTVAHYLTDAAAAVTTSPSSITTSPDKPTPRYSPASLTRWVSSINQMHTAAGYNAPGGSELVRRTLSGIRRTRVSPPRRRTPLVIADLKAILTVLQGTYARWPDAVAARRDAAILLMGFAGAHRRSELVGLTLADVTVHHRDGLHSRLRMSKTDQEARGAVRAVPFGTEVITCGPCAAIRWRQLVVASDTAAADTAEPGGQRRAVMKALRRQDGERIAYQVATHTTKSTTAGAGEGHICRDTTLDEVPDDGRPFFRTVHRTGAIGAQPMSGDAVAAMIQRRAAAAGYTPAQVRLLGGHSLRSGFVTEAFRAGADAHAIMRQTGHRDPKMLEVYAREHAPLVGNAVTRLGL